MYYLVGCNGPTGSFLGGHLDTMPQSKPDLNLGETRGPGGGKTQGQIYNPVVFQGMWVFLGPFTLPKTHIAPKNDGFQ